MTRAELIHRIAQNQSRVAEHDVELTVKVMLDHMAARLGGDGRIEIRRFGSFSLRFPPCAGRPQPQNRDAGVAPCQVCGLLQAGAEAARARQSRGIVGCANSKRCDPWAIHRICGCVQADDRKIG